MSFHRAEHGTSEGPQPGRRPWDLELEPGGYVAIEGDGSTRLGQLMSLELRHHDTTAAPVFRQIRLRSGGGDGVVLHGDERPFHDALVRRATPNEVLRAAPARVDEAARTEKAGRRTRNLVPRRAGPPGTSIDLTNWSLRPSYIGEPARLGWVRAGRRTSFKETSLRAQLEPSPTTEGPSP